MVKNPEKPAKDAPLAQGLEENCVQGIRRIVERVGGFDIEIPPREKEGRKPLRFEK